MASSSLATQVTLIEKDGSERSNEEINNDVVLMSLLEESQGEDRDEEQLNNVIRSLEAEIIVDHIMDRQDLIDALEFIDHMEHDQARNEQQVSESNHACSGSSSDFSWFDIDSTVPSSPSDDMNWYMDQYEDEMNSIVEFVGACDFSHNYYGVSMEEQSYVSLWQESHDEITYG